MITFGHIFLNEYFPSNKTLKTKQMENSLQFTNEVAERLKFWNIKYDSSFKEFLKQLHLQAELCEFKEKECMIRDKIVFNVSHTTQQRLLEEVDLDLQTAVKICQSLVDGAEQNAKERESTNCHTDNKGYNTEKEDEVGNGTITYNQSRKQLRSKQGNKCSIKKKKTVEHSNKKKLCRGTEQNCESETVNKTRFEDVSDTVSPQNEIDEDGLNFSPLKQEKNEIPKLEAVDADFFQTDLVNQNETDVLEQEMKELSSVKLEGAKTELLTSNETETYHPKHVQQTELVTNEVESFICPKCHRSFSYKHFLAKHLRLKKCARETVTFSCSYCNKRFPNQHCLVRHERIHTGEKPFTCSECGKGFAQKGDLVKHKRVHTGELPFSCQICGKCFAQQANLTRHMFTHSTEKPYMCDICGKCFVSNILLQKHKNRSHPSFKKFICLICDMRFAEKCALTKHTRTHTGEKPYKCSVCGKGFAEAGNRRQHERTHFKSTSDRTSSKLKISPQEPSIENQIITQITSTVMHC